MKKHNKNTEYVVSITEPNGCGSITTYVFYKKYPIHTAINMKVNNPSVLGYCLDVVTPEIEKEIEAHERRSNVLDQVDIVEVAEYVKA
jgi:hypothetical protein